MFMVFELAVAVAKVAASKVDFDIVVFVDGEDVNYCMTVRQRGY